MRLSGFLTRAQVETIHRNALRILAEAGVKVEHEGVRGRLEGIGGRVDNAAETVRFSAATVERLIADARKQPPDDTAPPHVAGRVGVYACRWLDPATNQPLAFNEERLARYVGLAQGLSSVDGINLLGLPFAVDGVPAACQPLLERLYAWQLGIRPSGSVLTTALCEPLLEMTRCHAAAAGRPVSEALSAVGYMVSPLRLARPECEQLLFFHERGLRMGIGHLPSRGGTAPVTFAGAVALDLAEDLFLYLLRRAFNESVVLRLGGDTAVIDMRTAALCYGRPEQPRLNAALAELARFYGCACSGHSGNTDAPLPSFEAGAQKALGVLFTALTTGRGSLSLGLLAVDELCSPVQMALDHDLLGALQTLLAPANASDADCAVEDIVALGPGGSHLATDLTVTRFRAELFAPRTWSAGSLSRWLDGGREIDVDKARAIVTAFDRDFAPASHIGADEERDLRAIIARAAQDRP